MTTDIRDCPPGTVPPWAIRVAYDGEEWLVLADDLHHGGHTCNSRPSARYVVFPALRFAPCSFGCDALTARVPWPSTGLIWHGDSLAEAEAAFTRIEQEWRAAKAGVL